MKVLTVVHLRCEYKKNPIGIDVCKPRLSWQMRSAGRNVMQAAYQIQVAQDGDSFADVLWDTGKIPSDRSVHVAYQGPALQSFARYYYRVRIWDREGNVSEWSEPAFWEMALLDRKDWIAEWITSGFATADTEDTEDRPCPMLRRTFEIKKKVKAARVYATSLGLYALYLNGSRVGEDLLTPGWTSYRKRLQYQTYDITGLLQEGKNAVGILLGDGWYKGNLVWKGNRNLFGDTGAALAQIRIAYEDGAIESVITDAQWKAATGPVRMSEIYHGETYDARLEREGWSTADCNDQDWTGVTTIGHSREILIAQENVPVRRVQEIKPVALFKTPAGELVLDMGQNMVGWLRFRASGKAGDEVLLQHAEVLDREGNFYTANLRGAKQTIRYILKGKGTEVFEPHFTFQGFRYVKICSYPGEPSAENFTGVVIHSDMEPTGSFRCSDELVNQLQHNILWGQKGNFVDVPTDCPQRDERLGWTGDAQVFIRTACFNMNAAPFFTKWLRDLKADQLENGGVPFVIPQVLEGKDHSSAAWGDAAVICPWTVYLCYGDERILEEQYDSMKAWVEYIRKQGPEEYLWNTGFHFGDWVGLDAKEGSYKGATSEDFIATAYFAYSTDILRRTAEILHRDADARNYGELYGNIVEAFRREFVTPGGRLAVPTQTAHVLALMFDLVEPKDKERVVGTLAKYLEENKNHLTTGFVGTPYLCHALSRNGRTDLAYTLLMQKDYPSWLYQVTKGATTIWEHWDGLKEDGSFWSEDMNSFNHYAYGSIGDWLYQVAAGIDTDVQNPGYKHIRIKPTPGGGWTGAEAELQSMYGAIKSAWHMDGASMRVEVSVPPNTSATLVLPSARLEALTESGTAVKQAQGVLQCEETDEGVVLELGSGTYGFVYKR